MPIPVPLPAGPLPVTEAQSSTAEAILASLAQVMAAGSSGSTLTTPALMIPNGVNPPPGASSVPYKMVKDTDQLIYRQLALALVAVLGYGKDYADVSGTPGPATSNTSLGRAAMATGSLSVAIVNSKVSSSSVVLVSPESVSSGVWSVVPGAGSFTVTLPAVTAAPWVFRWAVLS